MKHEHAECEHQVKYCKTCKIVYCTKCSKEWGVSYAFPYTQPYIEPHRYEPSPNLITWSSPTHYALSSGGSFPAIKASDETAIKCH